MRKLSKALIQTMKNDVNNVVFEKDGFVKILAKNGDVVVDWVNADTVKFAVDNYDELETACNEFFLNLVNKKYNGLSNIEKIKKAESEYTEHDKAVLASVNMDKLMGF